MKRRRAARSVVGAVAAVAMAAAMVGASAATHTAAAAAASDPVSRLAGADRYATSAAISAASFSPGVSVAYVATGSAFPDALSGAPAAGAAGVPLLLTAPTSIPTVIAAELSRLHPGRIVILGGTAVVSDAVATALRAYTSGSVSRLAGADRYATSAAISAASFSPGVSVAYVATGSAFPDALSGAPAAGAAGVPLLLTAPTSIPTVIAAELSRLHPGRIVILGGTAVVSDAVATALRAYTSGSVSRLAGADRYATSAAISAASFSPGVSVAYVATGSAFPDALSGAPAAGAAGAPLLLTAPNSVSTVIGSELTRLHPARIVILGGTAVVSDAVATALHAYTTTPAPVADVEVDQLMTTGVTLRWTNPRIVGFTGVTVRRAAGSTAPSSPSDGAAAVTTSGAVNLWADSGLTPGQTYSYALFAQYGQVYAESAPITVKIPTSPSLTGTVTGTAGEPISGVTVEVTTAAGATAAHPTTGADGGYTVAGLAPGDYTVCFVPAGGSNGPDGLGYLPQCWHDVTDGRTPTSVTVTSGTAVTGIDARLATAGAVSGTVTDTTGTPLQGVVVSVDKPGGDPVSYAATDSAGAWSVTGLPAGTYGVCFDPSGLTATTTYAPQCHQAVDLTAAPTLITVTTQHAVTGVNAALATHAAAASQSPPASTESIRPAASAAAAATGNGEISTRDLSNVPCEDILFLAARGSGQSGPGPSGAKDDPTDGSAGVGGQVYGAYNEFLLKAAAAGRTVTPPVSVYYKADSIWHIATSRYIPDLWQGVLAARDALKARAKQCPNEKAVLAGYSQGAMLMHRVLTNAATEGVKPLDDPAILNRVVASILIADGDRVAHDTTQDYGTAKPTAQGIGTQLDLTISPARLSSSLGARTFSVCDASDAVCDYRSTLLVGVPSDAYGVNVHLYHYTASANVNSAADAAASLALAALPPLPAPLAFTTEDPLPPATIGARYSITFTANGGTPPYTYGLASDIPDNGLDTWNKGTWSGTPTTTGTYAVTIQVTDTAGATASKTFRLTVSDSQPGGNTSATAISAGYLHTCAVTAGGGVKCWGDNSDGQLGDGTTTNSAVPVDVTGLTSGVEAISAGAGHTCAITAGGGVKCWGENSDGQLGDGTTTNSAVPVDVTGLTSGVQAISAGYEHTCALTTPGGVMCWGSNYQGELGIGSTATNSVIPVDVHGLASGVQAISAGSSDTCALTTAGGVKCWGGNNYGQLGSGSTAANSVIPVDVIGLTTGVQAIAVQGGHACALTTAGGVKCWGDNYDGQLGNASRTNSAIPVDVYGLTSGVRAVTAGYWHTCALSTSGALECWGWNAEGELGYGGTNNWVWEIPVYVIGLTASVRAISAGHYHTCALDTAGGVGCWGWNSSGQLGDGTTTESATPVEVVGF